MTKIKLCGIKRQADIDAVNVVCPDYIGFVFAKNRKRYICPNDAMVLKQGLSEKVKTVGVFVNEDIQSILEIVSDGIIDIIQLHGNENDSYIKQLKSKTDKPIIKAISINSRADIERANTVAADFVLLDSGKGGTGEAFDWDFIKNIDKPYFLAGGLNCENVSDALEKLTPYAVDVSSGIETDGQKDIEKMRKFVFSVRRKDTEKNDK